MLIKDGLNNVVGIVSSGLSVVEYTYDVWGSSSITRTDDINDISTLNPFRWKSHYYDNETGMYYINGRYYECEVGQFITPDYSSINPLMFGVNPDNYFSALSLYSDIPTPGSGGSTLLHFLKGAGFLSTSAFAIATAVTILTCGVASPLMIGVGVVTGIAGVATAVNGVAEIQEGFTGDNFMRDDIFGGNQTAYNWYSFGTDAVATVGSIWGGTWLKYNQPRIRAYKNMKEYNIKGKHLPYSNAKNGFSIFNTMDQDELRKLGREAIKKTPKSALTPNNLPDSYRIIYDSGRIIGTKGQTKAFIVIDYSGTIWTYFPKK